MKYKVGDKVITGSLKDVKLPNGSTFEHMDKYSHMNAVIEETFVNKFGHDIYLLDIDIHQYAWGDMMFDSIQEWRKKKLKKISNEENKKIEINYEIYL